MSHILGFLDALRPPATPFHASPLSSDHTLRLDVGLTTRRTRTTFELPEQPSGASDFSNHTNGENQLHESTNTGHMRERSHSEPLLKYTRHS